MSFVFGLNICWEWWRSSSYLDLVPDPRFGTFFMTNPFLWCRVGFEKELDAMSLNGSRGLGPLSYSTGTKFCCAMSLLLSTIIFLLLSWEDVMCPCSLPSLLLFLRERVDMSFWNPLISVLSFITLWGIIPSGFDKAVILLLDSDGLELKLDWPPMKRISCLLANDVVVEAVGLLYFPIWTIFCASLDGTKVFRFNLSPF